ncbi:hypothetical protein L915_18020, partial [Phytophthora nicotianae]
WTSLSTIWPVELSSRGDSLLIFPPTEQTCTTMPSLRTITLVVASALCVTGRSFGTAASTSTSSACSNVELQQVQTQIAAIRATLESDAGSSSKASSVPSTCVVALTFDLSAASKDDEETCANDCLAWIEDVVEAPTCGDEEMFMYKR